MKVSKLFSNIQEENIDLYLTESNKPRKLTGNDDNNNIKQEKTYPSFADSIKNRIKDFHKSFSEIKSEFIDLEKNVNSWKQNVHNLQCDVKQAISVCGSENVEKNISKLNCYAVEMSKQVTNDAVNYILQKEISDSSMSEKNGTKQAVFENRVLNEYKQGVNISSKKNGKVASKIAFFEKLKIPPVIRSKVSPDDCKLMKGIVATNIKFYENYNVRRFKF